MLLTDQLGYPRAYGTSIIYYLVMGPGQRPLYVRGDSASSYEAMHLSLSHDTEAELIDRFGPKCLPIPPNLLKQATECWRLLIERWRPSNAHR